MKTKSEAIAELESYLTKWPVCWEDVFQTAPTGWKWGMSMVPRSIDLVKIIGDYDIIRRDDVKLHVPNRPHNDDKLIELIKLVRSIAPNANDSQIVEVLKYVTELNK